MAITATAESGYKVEVETYRNRFNQLEVQVFVTIADNFGNKKEITHIFFDVESEFKMNQGEIDTEASWIDLESAKTFDSCIQDKSQLIKLLGGKKIEEVAIEDYSSRYPIKL